MIRAVLFDLDNTLIDFLKMKLAATEAAVSAMVDAGLRIYEQRGVRILYQMYHEHGFEDQKIFNKFLKKVHGKEDIKILAAGIAAYRKVKTSYVVAYPHARKTLVTLKARGLKLGIVSDAPKMQAWIRLAELNLLDFFDTVVAVGGTGKEKPNATPFKRAIRELRIPAENILFIGDNPDRDIKGAKRLGMKTALAKYGQVMKGKTKAHYELSDIENVIKIIK